MAETKTLAATVRSGTGKGAARSVRREGRIPGVIYGGGEAPRPIALDAREMNKLIYAGRFLTTIFEIDIDGTKERAIPRDYQLDVVKDTPMHVDFMRLKAGSRLRVDVPVHFINMEALAGHQARRHLEHRAPHGGDDGAGGRHSGIDHWRSGRPRHQRWPAHFQHRAAGRLSADDPRS